MRVSFDLDGTVCDSDWGWLDTLRRLGWPGDDENKYYACRNKILDPYRFLGKDDTGFILTGRPIHLKPITEEWLAKNGLGDLTLVFAMELPGRSKGTNGEFRSQAQCKVRYMVSNNIHVHFDDNSEVVNTIRRLLPEGYVVIHTGYHIGW